MRCAIGLMRFVGIRLPSKGVRSAPVEGNRIPSNRLSPLAQRILANVPLPNIEGVGSAQVNYQDTTVRERRTDGFDVKLNYQASPMDQVSGRYSFQRPTVFEPGNIPQIQEQIHGSCGR